MAVKEQSSTPIKQYWQRYWRRSIFFILAMQIIAVLLVAAALLYSEVIDPLEPAFWVTILSVLISVVAINILVAQIVTEPLKQLIAALSHSADEKSSLTPPNPNSPRFEKNGLKPVLQAIYEISASSSQNTAKADASDAAVTNSSTKDTLAETQTFFDAIKETAAGFGLFDASGKVVFANDLMPVKKNPDGTESLELEFYTEMSFETWLKECEEKAVHTSKSWNRIASKPVGEDGRKIYDIVASYHKESAVPVSVVVLEKTDEYKPEDDDLNFIAFAAHELRGPITVIRGYLDSLSDELDSTMDQEQKELFKRLIVSSNRLDSYINNILNSSRYDRRHFTVRLAEASISDIYQTIADDMQLRASSQERILTVDLPKTLPTVAADISSASEVLGNLIDNAIKYSNQGGVVNVTAEQHGDFLEIEVQDHGIGMPANVVSNLFHKFYRSHRSRETVAGTGIGLYISKAIVESHGGTVNVRSVEDEGSTFSFTLPIYSSVADQLAKSGGDNRTLISNHSGSWIKNHGSLRG